MRCALSFIGTGAGREIGLRDEVVLERAASMENARPEGEGLVNFGGSILVNGLPVLRRLRIPTLFLVGERPAGAERGVDLIVVLILGAGERAGRIGRR